MKITILNPSWGKDWCRSARWAAKSRGRVQRHPERLLTVVKGLEMDGHICHFIDAAALNISESETVQEILHFQPDLVLLHTTTPSIYNDLDYCRLLKQSFSVSSESNQFLVFALGNHVTVFPEEAFKITDNLLDGVIMGEYFSQALAIANKKDFGNILGIAFKSEIEGEIQITVNSPATPVEIDSLPFPAWNHINPHWYHDGGKLFPFLTLITARGCPYQCTFCRDPQTLDGHTLRLRDPKKIVDEMEYDLNLFPDLKEIMFETDTFTANTDHVKSICQEILNRNLKITWSCNVRVNMDLELLPLMKKAGCRMVMVGFEFGHQEGLDQVKKGITLEQSRNFAARATQEGFIIHGCFMIGAPNETCDSAMQTIQFALELPIDTAQFSGICVYPGTEMYEWAKNEHYLVPQQWDQFVDENHEQITVLNYPQLSQEEIDKLIDLGLKRFYFRPKQLWHMVTNIKNLSELKRKFQGFSRFMNYLKSKKLKNKRK